MELQPVAGLAGILNQTLPKGNKIHQPAPLKLTNEHIPPCLFIPC